MKEQDVLNKFRMDKASEGVELWHNPSGALYNHSGRLIRFGLCNDSTTINMKIKSSDLIGGEEITITQDMVGIKILQLVAYEIKHPQWKYKGDRHEAAQKVFIDKINRKGGKAAFVTINKEGEYEYFS